MRPAGQIIRAVLGISAVAVILICMTVASGTGKAVRRSTLCSGIAVTIKDSAENRFVSETDILNYLDKEYGRIEGIPAEDLDFKKIEDILNTRSAVLKSEAYYTKDGTLNILITQRKPVMRFQKGNSGFYADRDGYIFPMEPGRASHVVVIDGNIPLDLDKAGQGKDVTGNERIWLDRITSMVSYMNGHRTWAENIVQIHVLDNGDLVLIPREGKEKFIFGKPVRIGEKFSLMDSYYSAIVPAKGKDCYRRVDVRYAGQIICK